MDCHYCGTDFIESPTFPIEGYEPLCCLCLWPIIMTYSGEDCVVNALWNEIDELLCSAEGDFERIKPMEQASEGECSDSYDATKCGQGCGYHETCPWNDVYTLP